MPEQLVALVVVVLSVALLVAVSLGSQVATWGRELEALKGFARGLDDAQLREPTGAFPFRHIEDVSLTGSLSGHGVELRLEETGGRDGKEVRAWLAVEVPNAVSDFSIRQASVLWRVGRQLGLVSSASTGDPELDAKYILAGQEGTLRELFADERLEAAVAALFRFQATETVSLSEGWLRVVLSGERTAKSYRLATEALLRVARLCERRSVEATALGEQIRFAFTDAQGGARCPYCHDDLALEASDVSACSACGTLHHVDCFAEAGCTVFGCAERRSRERA